MGYNSNFIRGITSISGKQHELHPYFVTGFSDGESYFSIGLNRSTKMNTGWIVNLQFGISLHKKDRHILELIEIFFGGVRTVASQGTGKVQYRVSSINNLHVIILHFDNFPLITHKWSNFQLFKAEKKAVFFQWVKYKKTFKVRGFSQYCEY